MTIKDELDHAVRLRPAVEGDPTQGPYPATVDEVADEVVAWLTSTEAQSAAGLRRAVRVRIDHVLMAEAGYVHIPPTATDGGYWVKTTAPEAQPGWSE